MYNLIKADLFKLRKSLGIKILFGITTLCAITAAIMSYMIQQGSISVTSTNGIVFMFSDVNIMSILGAVVAGILICSDFDNRTIHEAIADGCSRGQIIGSKAVSFCCAIMFILLPYVIVISIGLITGYKFSMGSVAAGFMNILTTDGGKIFSASEIFKIAIIMLTLMIVYVGQLSVCIPFAIVFKKPVIVVAVYYGLTILFTSLAGLRSSSEIVKKIFNYTPYGNRYILMTVHTGAGDILKPVFVSLIFSVLMLAVTYMGFRKSEIK